MRNNTLKLIIFSLILGSCTMSINPIHAFCETVKNTSVNTSISSQASASVSLPQNIMSEYEARQLILNADSDYINTFLCSNPTSFLTSGKKINNMSMNPYYDIADEPCYVFSLDYVYDDLFIMSQCIYYVGINSKNVYVVNGTETSMNAYQLSDNIKRVVFKSKISNQSADWHENI